MSASNGYSYGVLILQDRRFDASRRPRFDLILQVFVHQNLILDD